MFFIHLCLFPDLANYTYKNICGTVDGLYLTCFLYLFVEYIHLYGKITPKQDHK